MTSDPQLLDQACPIADLAALGDGRSVALLAPDGAVVWWCVPNIDSPPLFDSLLDLAGGHCFRIAPDAPFDVARSYRGDTNVLETVLTTATGRARMTCSLNSSTAGRLPWCELARRVECLSGHMRLRVTATFATRNDTASPWLQATQAGPVFHVGPVLGLLRCTENVRPVSQTDLALTLEVTLHEGERALVALLAGEDEPLAVPPTADIDARIDVSAQAWQSWADTLTYTGPHRAAVCRSALALKLLLFSPSGAIAAAATTSLPERIGGVKNWDYRYAWVRDAGYVVNAFIRIGTVAESKAAFTWLLQRLGEHGPQVLYTLAGHLAPAAEELADMPGYGGSRPVRTGNAATHQHQHGIYGDIFETAALFIGAGNILDQPSARILAGLADRCADTWRQKDAGIWELEEPQHYTMSKVSCWQALARAVELADHGHLASDSVPRWSRERDRIAEWIDAHCWSERRGAYTFYPGTDRLDASLCLAVRFGFDRRERLAATLDRIRSELGRGPLLYRYSGAEQEEGAFLACSFWLVEALATLGRRTEAETLFQQILARLPPGLGVLSEMMDPDTGALLGNTPQALSHLALIHAACTLHGDPDRPLAE